MPVLECYKIKVARLRTIQMATEESLATISYQNEGDVFKNGAVER